MGIVLKIWTWIKKNGAGLAGLLNSLVKIVRELIIVVIRIVALVLPDKFVEETLIKKISDIFNKIEGWLKIATDWLLKLT